MSVLIMKKLYTFVMVVVMVGFVNVSGNEISTEKQEDIRRLINMVGSGDIGLQVMDQLVETFKHSMPQVPVSFWEGFMEEIDTDMLIELTVPIYDKFLSHSDIKDLIEFYETPAGRRFIAALPDITKESMEVGQKWGEKIGMKIFLRLQEEEF
ncbi:hypothetical protein CHISP_1499 [Chitinispirillum alkaliphilum]|nr:hypothetical protein CHISP_1499 [Chitinispirillum alkaliphilum]